MKNDTLFLREFVEIKVNSEDEGVGLKSITFQLDSGTFQTGAKLEARNSGSHSVLFRAEDYLGNHADTSLIFYVDNSPPELTVKMSQSFEKQYQHRTMNYSIFTQQIPKCCLHL